MVIFLHGSMSISLSTVAFSVYKLVYYIENRYTYGKNVVDISSSFLLSLSLPPSLFVFSPYSFIPYIFLSQTCLISHAEYADRNEYRSPSKVRR